MYSDYVGLPLIVTNYGKTKSNVCFLTNSASLNAINFKIYIIFLLFKLSITLQFTFEYFHEMHLLMHVEIHLS